jgi:phosphoglycerate dehydrogenase-like enzyme
MANTRPKILIDCDLYFKHDELSLFDISQRGPVDGIIAGTKPYNTATLSLNPRLKILSRVGVGVDNIDDNALK